MSNVFISLTKFSVVFPVKLNIHIVFEGEKEFHRSVKLWGVSIRIFLLKKKKTNTKTQTLSFLFQNSLVFLITLLIKRNSVAYHSIITFKSDVMPQVIRYDIIVDPTLSRRCPSGFLSDLNTMIVVLQNSLDAM